MSPLEPVAPIHTIELFPPLSQELLAVLKSLRPADWSRPTACSRWTIKDVAAHLLGGNFGRLWPAEYRPAANSSPDPDYASLVEMIDRNNALWVDAAQRISPPLLIELLELTDHQLYDLFRSWPPEQPAKIPVAWAGESTSPTWFDIAREYTEKWLHQQHIRDAAGIPILIERRWLHPVLDTFLRGLPHTYRDVAAPEGTQVSIQITGPAGGDWTLTRDSSAWRLFRGQSPNPACSIAINQDLAWRLFTKGIRPEQAWNAIQIDGNETLSRQFLMLVSIMA